MKYRSEWRPGSPTPRQLLGICPHLDTRKIVDWYANQEQLTERSTSKSRTSIIGRILQLIVSVVGWSLGRVLGEWGWVLPHSEVPGTCDHRGAASPKSLSFKIVEELKQHELGSTDSTRNYGCSYHRTRSQVRCFITMYRSHIYWSFFICKANP